MRIRNLSSLCPVAIPEVQTPERFYLAYLERSGQSLRDPSGQSFPLDSRARELGA